MSISISINQFAVRIRCVNDGNFAGNETFRTSLASPWAVAAAILAAVEGGILPPGMATLNAELTAKSTRPSAGNVARLDGRLEACRYPKH